MQRVSAAYVLQCVMEGLKLVNHIYIYIYEEPLHSLCVVGRIECPMTGPNYSRTDVNTNYTLDSRNDVVSTA